VTTSKIVRAATYDEHGLGMLAADDSVWVTVSPSWWDLASWLWWWLCPSDRKAWVILTNSNGEHFRIRGIRISRKHVRLRNVPKPLRRDS